MTENLRHKVYFHQKRFGRFTRGKKRREDDELTTFAKENKCNSIAEIRVFTHRGYPVKNVRAKRIKDGVEVSTGKSNFNVKVEEDIAEITGPAIGTELEMRIINNDPCFWLIGKRKAVKKDEHKAKKMNTKKGKTTANTVEKDTTPEESKTEIVQKGKVNTKSKNKKKGGNKKQEQLKKKKQQQQRNKNKRKRKASKDGKTAKKRKLNNVATKNEASRNLIAQLASTDESSKRDSLKKSHARVDKFEEKLEKKQFLSKRKKMQIMKVKGAFNEQHTKRKTKKKQKQARKGAGGGKKVRFAT